MTQEIVIERKLPSLNDYIRDCRGNRYNAAKVKRDIECDLWTYLRKLKPINVPVRISFVWYEPNKKRDPDNIAFAKKFILDAMQNFGLLENDNQTWIKGFTDDFASGKDYKVQVIIKEA